MLSPRSLPRQRIVTSARARRRRGAAWPAEFAPPTTKTCSPAHDDCLAARGAVVDPTTGQLLDARHLEAPVLDPRRHHHGVGPNLAPVAEAARPATSRAPRSGDRPRREHLRAETLGLRGRPAGEVGAREPHRETQVVLDPRALARLPARRLALDQHRPQALRCAVHRGGQPGRAAADDHQVVERHLGPVADPGRARRAPPSSAPQRLTAGSNTSGSRAAAPPLRPDGRPPRRARCRASGTARCCAQGSPSPRATRARSDDRPRGSPPRAGRRRLPVTSRSSSTG